MQQVHTTEKIQLSLREGKSPNGACMERWLNDSGGNREPPEPAFPVSSTGAPGR